MNVSKLTMIISWLIEHLQKIYSIDARSLALLRISVGLVTLYELFTRFQLRHAFYSDVGVLPRRDAVQTVTSAQWSLLMANGTSTFVTAFFLLAILAAILFTLGYRTRAVSIALWVAVLSIQFRNPYLNNGGDVLLRAVLFWAMFLPLGQVWSLDSRIVTEPGRQEGSKLAPIVSIAGFALIAQQFVVYFCTALLKTDDQWKVEGSALYYALGLKDYSNGVGDWLFHNAPEELLQFLTFSTLLLEYVAPILILLPLAYGPFRTIGTLLIVGLHLGIMSTMTVGLFPFVAIASVLGILPTWFWESLLPRIVAFGQRTVLSKFAMPKPTMVGPSTVVEPILTEAHPASALYFVSPLSHFRFTPSLMSNAVVTVILACMLLSNLSFVSAFELPRSAWNVTHATGLRQKWNMFAPKPVIGTRWYVVEGELTSGKKIDLLVALDEGDLGLQMPVQWDQSEDVNVKSKLWRKYFSAIRSKDVRIQSFARYTCRSWNSENEGDTKLVNVTISSGISKTLPNSQRDEPAYSKWLSWNCG